MTTTQILAALMLIVVVLEHVWASKVIVDGMSLSPSDYFLKRNHQVFKSLRRDNSSPFKYEPNTRIHNLDKQPKRTLHKNDDGGEFQSYDGTIARKVIILDQHPMIIDAGCGLGTMYLRVKREHVEMLSRDIKVGTTLISSDRSFFQCLSQRAIMNVVTSSSIKEIENSSDKYFELKVRSGQLQDVFMNLSYNMRMLPEKPSNSTQQMKRWSIFHDVLFNVDLVNWNYDKKTKKAKESEFADSYFHSKPGEKIYTSYSCKDCYVYVGAGLEVSIEMGLLWLDNFELYLLPNINSNIDFTLEAYAQKKFTIPIIPKTDVFFFTIIFIPCTVFVEANFRVKIDATLNLNVRFSFNRVGKIGFKGTKPVNDVRGDGPSFSITNYGSSATVEAALVPSIGISAIGIIDFSSALVPYYGITFNAPSTKTKKCALSFENYYGIDMEFLLGRVSIIGITLYSGFEQTITLVKKKNLGATCLMNSRRALTSSAEVVVMEVPCCNFTGPVVVNQQATMVDLVLQFSSDSYNIGDFLIMDGCSGRKCILFYDDISSELADSNSFVDIGYLKERSISNITLRIEKSIDETVSLDIYVERDDVELGQSFSMTRGTFGVLQPFETPRYISFINTNGSEIKISGSDEIVSESDLLDMAEVNYPVYFSFSGNGKVTGYPIYEMTSGKSLKLLLDASKMFGVRFNISDTVGSNIVFDTMILSSTNVPIISGTSNLDSLVNIQLYEDSSYSVKNFELLNQEQVYDGFLAIEYDMPQEFLFFNVYGSFPSMYFNLEVLVVYSVDLISVNKTKFVADLPIIENPIVLRIIFDQTFQNGMIISFTEYINVIVHTDVPTQRVIQDLSLKKVSKFAFSQYFNSEMNTGELYARVEPSFMRKSRSSLFSMNVEALASNVLEVSLKFISSESGEYVDSITFEQMFTNSTRIAIISKDKQYSINFNYFSSSMEVFKLIKASVNGTSYWNNVAIPVLNYYFTTADMRDVVQSIDTQTLILTIPQLPKANIEDETLEFGQVNPKLFMPPPKQLNLLNTLIINNIVLQQSDVKGNAEVMNEFELGVIISSSVGGSLILIMFLILVILVGCLIKQRSSKKQEQPTQETKTVEMKERV